MKILEITLRNLNSLRGEWKINFEDEAFKSDGIFAVTGPTGAGKTTIFDAVCLALYGRTPRLTGSRKEEIAEIMSKHTKYCSAKVTFEAARKNYVCEWSMTRRKDKTDGEKFDTEHTITEDGVKKQKGVSAHVGEITGLDFRQFTQAALLAQGEFDAFLSGSDTERAKILELLTGTGIYSEISKKIVEHRDAAQKLLADIKKKRDETIPNDGLGSDEEISREITETRGKISALKNERSEIESALTVLREIHKLRGELLQNQNDIAGLEKIIAASQGRRLRLESGIRARDILPVHTELSGKRRHFTQMKERADSQEHQLDDDRSKLAMLERELESLESSLKQITAGLPEGETPESICAEARLRVKAFIDTYKEKAKISSERDKAEKEYAEAAAASDSAKANEESARRKYEHAREILSRLMNARVSAILEAERMKLKPGVPCPVCGSTEHPAISHYVHESDGSEKEILQADGDLKKARDRENQELRNSQEAWQKLSDARKYEAACHERLGHSARLENEYTQKITEAKLSVSEVIVKIGIHAPKSCEEIISRVNEWESKAKNLSARITETNTSITSLRGQIDANSKTLKEDKLSLSAMKKELESLEEKFTASLAAKNFTDEKHFTDSILTDAQMSSLQEDLQNNDEKMKGLLTLREDRMKHLAEEEARVVTAMTLEEAERSFNGKDDEIDSLRNKLIRLEAAQESRKKLQSERETLDAEYKSQEEKYNNWEAFNQKLGSKNGGKFGRFAQRITLRMLVQLSNKQLERMNSRYTIMLTPGDNNLGLSVRDSEQAGTIRPTSNLSGGEKFIISLALALGLSQISGSKAQVDSLFIDEGFGSLDDDALNAALDALGEIHRDGRMIGIISHISGISERIPAKINVIRKSEGTSIIIGPGCSGSANV